MENGNSSSEHTELDDECDEKEVENLILTCQSDDSKNKGSSDTDTDLETNLNENGKMNESRVEFCSIFIKSESVMETKTEKLETCCSSPSSLDCVLSPDNSPRPELPSIVAADGESQGRRTSRKKQGTPRRYINDRSVEEQSDKGPKTAKQKMRDYRNRMSEEKRCEMRRRNAEQQKACRKNWTPDRQKVEHEASKKRIKKFRERRQTDNAVTLTEDRDAKVLEHSMSPVEEGSASGNEMDVIKNEDTVIIKEEIQEDKHDTWTTLCSTSFAGKNNTWCG